MSQRHTALHHETDPEDAMQTRMIHPLKFCILNDHPQIISLASHEVQEFSAIFITRVKIKQHTEIGILVLDSV